MHRAPGAAALPWSLACPAASVAAARRQQDQALIAFPLLCINGINKLEVISF